MILAGSLSKRVTIINYSFTKNEYGATKKLIKDSFNVWAELKEQRADEHAELGNLATVNTQLLAMRIRFNEKVTADSEVEFKGKTYKITALNYLDKGIMKATLQEKARGKT